MLEIKNLTVKVENKQIINDLNIKFEEGKIHVIMGPNGTGKSTLCKVIMGSFGYEVLKGEIFWHDKDLIKMNPTNIAREKVFLLSQNPMQIEGVSNAEMLRTSLAEITGKQVGIFEFNKKMEAICQKLNIPNSFIHRQINVGMSGGERKKNELLHMWMLEPELILLDEIDSGLDVDAIKTVAQSINEYYKLFKPTILIITHQPKILKLIKVDYVHVMMNGKIIKSGDILLANLIEEEGYTKLSESFGISGQDKSE